jgi:molybdate transport system permease protein
MYGLLLEYIRDERFLFPLLFTAKVTVASTLLQLVFGILLGKYLSQRPSRFRSAVDLVVTLPLVFPPIALGFLLLLILGNWGPIGPFLDKFLGVQIIFTVWGVIIASFIAGLPLIVKPVQSAIQTSAQSLIEASYTLGKSEWETFFCVVLPNIKKTIISGLSLAFGRSLGEVGLTLMLGGDIVGKTNTLSLEIYNAVFSGEFERAMVLAAVLGLTSAGIFLSLKKLAV